MDSSVVQHTAWHNLICSNVAVDCSVPLFQWFRSNEASQSSWEANYSCENAVHNFWCFEVSVIEYRNLRYHNNLPPFQLTTSNDRSPLKWWGVAQTYKVVVVDVAAENHRLECWKQIGRDKVWIICLKHPNKWGLKEATKKSLSKKVVAIICNPENCSFNFLIDCC